MLQRLDRYLLRGSIWLFLGFLGLAISILLIERLIRLTEVLSGADNVAFNAVRLVSSLIPHYFELALPGALLLTTILTIHRLSRSSEITVILTSGVSLYRIARPFVLAGIVLAGVSIFTTGYLQPQTRYYYRSVVFELRQNSIVAAFEELKFVQFDNWTIWTDGLDTDQTSLGETFIYERNEDGSSRFFIGRSGALDVMPEGGSAITLNDAMIGELPATIGDGRAYHASTGQLDWQLPVDRDSFRSRGLDERELTLNELLSYSYEEGDFKIDLAIVAADTHDRLVRAAILPVLALTGIFLGLNLGRNPRAGGVFTGILLLLILQKALEFGLLKAQQGLIPPWAGSWPVFGVLTLGALILFARANGAQYRRFGLRIDYSAFAGWFRRKRSNG